VFSAIGANLDLLLEEVLDGGVVEHALGRFGRFEPGVAHGAGRPPVGAFLRGRFVDELVRYHWALQGGDDVAQGQLTWIAGELVATVWTSYAVDDAYSPQAAEQLVEVRLGYLLTRRDFGTLHWPLAVTAGKLDDGVGAVVAAHGQSHGKLSNPINIIRNSGFRAYL
jgi:hypothetical protein